jgi:uncharacterized protein YraI
MNIIKASANIFSVTTANSVNNTSILFVSTTAAAQINLYSNSTTQYASFVLPASQYIFVQKNPTDLISSNVAINVTPSAYRG